MNERLWTVLSVLIGLVSGLALGVASVVALFKLLD